MAKASDEDRAGELLVQEVDEDLRRDQYVKFWKQYGRLIIAAAVLVVLVVAGYQGWLSLQRQRRMEAAERYAAAMALVDAGKTQDAEAALAAIAGGDAKGFAALAAMRRAELLSRNGDAKGAIAAYESLATSDAPKLMRDLATLKEGLLALNGNGDTASLEARLGVLTDAESPWRFSAQELLALFARKKGDDKRALDLFKKLADDPAAPPGVRARAAEVVAAIAPPPASATAAPATAATPKTEAPAAAKPEGKK